MHMWDAGPPSIMRKSTRNNTHLTNKGQCIFHEWDLVEHISSVSSTLPLQGAPCNERAKAGWAQVAATRGVISKQRLAVAAVAFCFWPCGSTSRLMGRLGWLQVGASEPASVSVCLLAWMARKARLLDLLEGASGVSGKLQCWDVPATALALGKTCMVYLPD